jgi:carboxyl-terminal processing protease
LSPWRLSRLGSLRWQSGQASPSSANDPYRQLSRFGVVFDAVRRNYVEAPDEGKLIEAAQGNGGVSRSALGIRNRARLPQHGVDREGEVGFVGVELVERESVPVVVEVTGVSAQRAGILPGDRIEAIDGEPTNGLTIDQANEKMRGPVNSVSLAIARDSGSATAQFKILRDVRRIKEVGSRVECGDIRYIKIEQFTETTADELGRAIPSLRAEVPLEAFKGYIIDLRNNPGGYVDQAIETVNAFVSHGKIVATKGRERAANCVVFAHLGRDLSQGKPIAVLVNGGIDAIDDPSRGQHFATDDRSLLHAVRTIDSGTGHRPRHRDPQLSRTPLTTPTIASAKHR